MTQGGRKPTKAERKEEARKARLAELRRRQRKARMRKFYYGGAAVLVIGGIVAAVLTTGQASKKKISDFNKIAAAAGCDPVKSLPIEGHTHVPRPQKVTYGTNPPTSGNHWADSNAPARTGVYTSPGQLQDEEIVHNMEHSHVIIQYTSGLTNQDLINKLEDLVRQHNRRMIIAPRASMQDGYILAFTAWGKLDGCKTPNDKAIDAAKAFFDTFKGEGPEGFLPGTPVS